MGAGAAVGRGMVAGLLGTVALTLSEALEMRITGRQASDVPGQVGAKLFGIEPDSDQMERLSQAMHWGHGILSGSVRGLVSLTGARGLPASALHFGALWGSDAALYAALGIAPPPWRWSARELATDMGNKGVYALATGAAYDRLAARA